MKLFEQHGDDKGIAQSFNNIGVVYKHQGDFKGAIYYHQKSLTIRRKLNDFKGIADSYNNLGISYKYLHRKDEALKNLFASLEIFKKIHEDSSDSETSDSETYEKLGQLIPSPMSNSSYNLARIESFGAKLPNDLSKEKKQNYQKYQQNHLLHIVKKEIY